MLFPNNFTKTLHPKTFSKLTKWAGKQNDERKSFYNMQNYEFDSKLTGNPPHTGTRVACDLQQIRVGTGQVSELAQSKLAKLMNIYHQYWEWKLKIIYVNWKWYDMKAYS